MRPAFVKIFCLSVVLFIGFASSAQAQVQDAKNLPDDPRVCSGKLANGLSYILIKNNAQKGKADVGVLQKVGTSLEGKSQKAMFKLLEMLTMRGTRNFDDASIQAYLSSIGVPASNVDFSTGADQIAYTIRDVPTQSENQVDSTLLILYNWLGSLNLDEDDIKDESVFLKSRLSYENTAQARLNDALLKELYPKCNYYQSLTPEQIAAIGNYSSKNLRSFYYDWFRPEFQCIAIAGDIDLKLMESKIKSLFVTIPKSIDKKERKYYTPKDYKGVKVCIKTDKEYNKTLVTIAFLKKPLLKKYRGTALPYLQEYFDEMVKRSLSDRLNAGMLGKNLSILNLKVEKGRFLDISNLDAFSISFETLPEYAYSAVSFVGTEIENIAKNGFNSQEIHKNRDLYFKEIEALYNGRNTLANSFYFNRIKNHFFDSYTLASVEMKFEMLKEMVYSTSMNDVNNYAQKVFNSNDNTLIYCFMPQKKGMMQLSEERLLSSYSSSALSAMVASGAEVLAWPVLLLGNYKSTIVSETKDEALQADIVHLSNGATLVFKNDAMPRDTIELRAVSKGGYSLIKGVTPNMERFVNMASYSGGLEEMPCTTVDRLFSYNDIEFSTGITAQNEYIYGRADKSDSYKMLEAVYMAMMRRRSDQPAYDAMKKAYIYEINTQSLNPQEAFRDTVAYYGVSNKNFVKSLDAASIEALDYGTLKAQIDKRFSNAADWTFIFCGDFDYEQLKAQAVKCIGAIPGNPKNLEGSIVIPNYVNKNNVDYRFLFKMVSPRTFVSVTRNMAAESSLKNYIIGYMSMIYLRNRIEADKSLRMLSNVDVSYRAATYPEQIASLHVGFESDSTFAQNGVDRIHGILSSVARGGMDGDSFNSLKASTKAAFLAQCTRRSFWLTVLERKYMDNKDYYSNFMDILSGISKDEFQAYIRKFLDNSNDITIIMDGTTKDVNTQNLFKRDDFIREYFNVK